jgi:hypothetical protein
LFVPRAISGGYDRIVSIAKAKVGFIEPMLALAVTKLPEGPAWSDVLQLWWGWLVG